jgi:tetratricopeptide (TPR) repeat protein
MERKIWTSMSWLLFASLLGTSPPALAQNAPAASGKEIAARWENANPRFLKGKECFVKKDFDRAEAEFKACLEILPEHADALFFLAQLDYGRGDFARALDGIEKAEASHSAFAGTDSLLESQRRLALLEERKKKEREVASMEEILYAGSCKTDDEMLKLPEAIATLRRDISAINAKLNAPPRVGPQPVPADYSYVHGNILFKLNRTREAGHQYLRAIASDARHAGAYNNLINLFYMAKDYGNALKFIDRAEASGVVLNGRLKSAVMQLAKK